MNEKDSVALILSIILLIFNIFPILNWIRFPSGCVTVWSFFAMVSFIPSSILYFIGVIKKYQKVLITGFIIGLISWILSIYNGLYILKCVESNNNMYIGSTLYSISIAGSLNDILYSLFWFIVGYKGISVLFLGILSIIYGIISIVFGSIIFYRRKKVGL